MQAGLCLGIDRSNVRWISEVDLWRSRGRGDEARSGLTLSGIGVAIFIVSGFFFEVVIGISGFRLGAAWQCWPGLLNRTRSYLATLQPATAAKSPFSLMSSWHGISN